MSNLAISFINIPVFMVEDVMTLCIIVMVIIIVTYIIYFINSCTIAKTKSDLCYLYFLFDTVFVAKCTAIAGLFGLFMIMLPMNVPIMMMAVLVNMDLFIFAGNCRIILAYCKYKTWQVLVFKMTIFFCQIFYIIIAAYVMTNPAFIPAPK